jgi:hypothetical protein
MLPDSEPRKSILVLTAPVMRTKAVPSVPTLAVKPMKPVSVITSNSSMLPSMLAAT